MRITGSYSPFRSEAIDFRAASELLAPYGIMWPNEQDFSSDTIIYDITNPDALSPMTPH